MNGIQYGIHLSMNTKQKAPKRYSINVSGTNKISNPHCLPSHTESDGSTPQRIPLVIPS